MMKSHPTPEIVLSAMRKEKMVWDLGALSRTIPPIVVPFETQTRTMTSAFFYLATSPILDALAAVTGLGFCKIGCTFKDPVIRIKNLNDIRYAGFWGRPDALRPVPGADAWSALSIRNTSDSALCMPAVTVHPQGHASIEVSSSLSIYDVDSALTGILARRRARPFFASRAGRGLLERAGLTDGGWFYTQYLERGHLGPLRAVEDIFVLDPEKEIHLLLEALDGLAHLGTSSRLKPHAGMHEGCSR